jgi:hypothetical protein
MKFDLAALLDAAKMTVKDPRRVARYIIGLQLPASTGWLAVALAVVLSALLSVISSKLSPYAAQAGYDTLLSSPLRLALLQGVLLIIGLGLIMGIGRAMGGRGRLSDALALLAWLEAVLILIQVVQVVLMLVSFQLAVLLGLVTYGLFLWMLASFIAELHGFRSALKVLGMILLTILAISFLLALFGIGIPAGV